MFLARIFRHKDADRGGVCKKQDPHDDHMVTAAGNVSDRYK